MKKTICILSIMMLVSVSFGHLWTNASGDQDFTRGSNWFDLIDGHVFTSSDHATVQMSGANAAILSTDSTRGALNIGTAAGVDGEVYITGGTNTFTNGQFASGSGATSLLDVSGGDTTFSGFFTIGNRGYGEVNISGGTVNVNRSQLCQNDGSQGHLEISGGEFNVETHFSISRRGTGSVNMTGGTIHVGTTFITGRDVPDAVATLTMSGDAEFNALGSFTNIGQEGYSAIYMNGGTLNLDRVSFGREDDPNSRGYMFITDGVVNISQFCTIATSGQAGVEVSGGVLNANRMLLGQGSPSATSYLANGYLDVSGGEVNITSYLEVGRDGEGTLILDGNSGQINLAQFRMGEMGQADFILNGTAGVGKGIAAFAGVEMDGFDEVVNVGNLRFVEGAAIGASFADGTDVAGDYIVISSSERATYLPDGQTDVSFAVPIPAGDMTDFLTAEAQAAGWTATLVNAGSGSAVILTSPIAANKTAWAGAGADDIAVIEDDSVALSTAKTSIGAVIGEITDGSLDVSAGADAQFANLTIGEDAESTGSMNITGGSVAADSIAYIGKEGSADVNISGGSFSAFNLLAATGEEASADIKVSGAGSLDAGNALSLSSGSKLTVSGYQTSVTAANLTLGQGANITFELDENHGVGNGVVVENNVVLKGTISTVTLGERIDTTYTVLRAAGNIFVDNANLIDSPFVNYEIVENGDYQELQVTFFTPEDCGDVIASGFGLAADINNDCYVDIQDFAIMALEWLSCNDPTNPECDLILE